jgi:thiamine biosynthesis lipoprotein
MGTILEITLLGLDEESGETLLEELYAEVAHREAIYSRHDPRTELARLNRSAGGAPFLASAALFELLRFAETWREQSGGAFDVTVGAWVELWERAAQRDRIPDAAERARVESRVGAGVLRLFATRQVALAAGSSVDLDAVAKGATLDVMADRLREAEVPAALLNFGESSYWAWGSGPSSEGWRLALRHPAVGVAGVLTLRDQALSVSASLGQFSEIAGRRYGHVIDPRTGKPLLRNAQAAVIAPSAAAADAISTALLVLGPDAGLAWVETLRQCEAMWIDSSGARETSGWRRRTGFSPQALEDAETQAGRK